MGIGRTFNESLQKALRGLEIGRFGLGCDSKDKWATKQEPSEEEIKAKLTTPNEHRIWHIRYAMKLGFSVDQIHELTKIDPWFLDHLSQIVEFENTLLQCESLEQATPALILKAKQHGFSDRQLAHLFSVSETPVSYTHLTLPTILLV